MKKQILIILIAIMASSTVAWSQANIPLDPDALTSTAAPYCVPATPILAACVPASGPLNPIAGTLYNYSITIANGGTTPRIHWLVTTEPAFIVAGVLTTDIEAVGGDFIMAAGTSYNIGVNAATPNTVPNVDITWKSFAPTTDVFLVTYVENEAGCTDNIKVYKIEPVHVFTLDMAALNFDGTVNSLRSNCVSSVQGATYVEVLGVGEVQMDYGLNYMYFTVNAANYAHSWLPTFQVTATNTTASSTIAVDWAYPSQSFGVGAVWHETFAAGSIYTSGTSTTALDPVLPSTTGATGVGALGECIVVRVTIDHNLNETLDHVVLSFSVDGIMYDQLATNYTNPLMGDIHFQAGTDPGQECPWYDGYLNDATTFTLTRRPTLTDQTDPDPDDNFIPDNGE